MSNTKEMNNIEKAGMEVENLDCLTFLSEKDDVPSTRIFTVNDRVQVVFITDLKVGKKLDQDLHVNQYLFAVIEANLLKSAGLSHPDQIFAITRCEKLDDFKTTVVISVDEQDDELRCSMLDEGFYTESEESLMSEDTQLWNKDAFTSENSTLWEDATLSDDCPSWNPQVQESSNSSDPSLGATPGPTLKWESRMTKQLIQIRGNMNEEFAKAKYKFSLWEQVAIKLKELLPNVKITAKDCDDKWRNIVATYRKNIDKIKCCGENNVIRWEHFTAMDNILKGTRELLMGTEVCRHSDEALSTLVCSKDATEVEVIDHLADLSNNSEENLLFEEIEVDELEEDSLQDCIITRKSNGEKRRWSAEQCLLLIYLRKEMDCKFKKSYDKAPNLWREIASQMNMNFLSDFTASELESVWNHCNITYEVNLETLKSKGVTAINWKYFAIMDELRGGTREIAELCVPRPGERWLEEFQKLKHPSLLPRTDVSTCAENYETESEDAVPLSPAGVVWTQDMVMTLISLKKSIDQDIAKHKISRQKQWRILVRRFRALKHVKVKVPEGACEEKWRNLVRTYKKNLARVRRRGGNAIRWPYFWRMHEILGNSVDYEESQTDVAKKCSPIETPMVPINRISTLPLSEQFLVESPNAIAPPLDDPLRSSREHDLSDMIDLKNKENRRLYEVIGKQNEKIEELCREQSNIKSLLTQLLQKFP